MTKNYFKKTCLKCGKATHYRYNYCAVCYFAEKNKKEDPKNSAYGECERCQNINKLIKHVNCGKEFLICPLCKAEIIKIHEKQKGIK